MANITAVNPIPFLAELAGQAVVVRLKWGMEYKGVLKSTDRYMNLQLLNTEEWIDGSVAGNLGEIMIRCNNVLFIRGASVPANEDADPNEQKKRRTARDE